MIASYRIQMTVILGSLLILCCLLMQYMYVPRQTIIHDNMTSPGLDWCQKLYQDFKSKTIGASSWQYGCLLEREMNKAVSYRCKDARWMGNWQVCFDEKYQPRKPCLVYSVGIANDFSFDDAMAQEGCEVYSFDPSMGVKDHQRSKRVTFKNMALGINDTDHFSARKDLLYVHSPQIWKMRTLKSIMKMLNHEKRFLDVLKLDIEAGEYEVIKNIIKDGLLPQIGQILIDWHMFLDAPPPHSLKPSYHLVRDFNRLGLQSFYIDVRNTKVFFNAHACYVNTF